jgi:AmpE protein
MKLLVIVLCLLSERFLVHAALHKRFYWISAYINFIAGRLSKVSPWIILSFILLPFVVVVSVILYYFSNSVFGFVGLLLNLIIVYCCIGPGNPFYPVRVQANGQLFAVIFWYITLGPLAALVYRLIAQSRKQQSLSQIALKLTNILDWLPARMTILLYLLVGNFQAGLRDFGKLLFKTPSNNQILLSVCGLQALSSNGVKSAKMLQAEKLVEYAVILLLVLLAFFTLVAWM